MRRPVLAAVLAATTLAVPTLGAVGLVPAAAQATTPPSLVAAMPCLGGGRTTVSASPTATGTHVAVAVTGVDKLNWGGGILVGADSIAQESTELPAVAGPVSAVGGRFHQSVEAAKPWPQDVLAVYATAHAKQVCGLELGQSASSVWAVGDHDALAVRTAGKKAVFLRLGDDVVKGTRWRVTVTLLGGGKQTRTLTLTAGRHGLQAKIGTFRHLSTFATVVVRATALAGHRTSLLMGIHRS